MKVMDLNLQILQPESVSDAELDCTDMHNRDFFFGVSENDGTRAYIFVNTSKPLGQTGSI